MSVWIHAGKKQINLRLLYRAILKSAMHFPSTNRDSIIEEIRVGFRANKNETDENLLQEHVNTAVNGLMQLEQYRSLNRDSHLLEFKAISNPIYQTADGPPDLMQILASTNELEIPTFVTAEARMLLENFREKELAISKATPVDPQSDTGSDSPSDSQPEKKLSARTRLSPG